MLPMTPKERTPKRLRRRLLQRNFKKETTRRRRRKRKSGLPLPLEQRYVWNLGGSGCSYNLGNVCTVKKS